MEPLHSGSNMANSDFSVLKNCALSQFKMLELLLLRELEDANEEAEVVDEGTDDSVASTS
jgi:hypothetical protein